MTWSLVSAGTLASGSNVASLAPAIPAGNVGDLLILQTQNFGGTGARTPQLPSGWTDIVSGTPYGTNGTSYHLAAYRIADGTEDATVTVTMSGTGVTSDTQLARVARFRSSQGSATAPVTVGAWTTNASADNIGPISGITVPSPANGGTVMTLVFAGKSNDWNGSPSLTNWTSTGTSESTAGNDAGMALLYRLNTPSGATGSLTVVDSGGTASNGVGLGLIIAFDEPAQVISASSDDSGSGADALGYSHTQRGTGPDVGTFSDELLTPVEGSTAETGDTVDAATLTLSFVAVFEESGQGTDEIITDAGIPPQEVTGSGSIADEHTSTLSITAGEVAESSTAADAYGFVHTQRGTGPEEGSLEDAVSDTISSITPVDTAESGVLADSATTPLGMDQNLPESGALADSAVSQFVDSNEVLQESAASSDDTALTQRHGVVAASSGVGADALSYNVREARLVDDIGNGQDAFGYAHTNRGTGPDVGVLADTTEVFQPSSFTDSVIEQAQIGDDDDYYHEYDAGDQEASVSDEAVLNTLTIAGEVAEAPSTVDAVDYLYTTPTDEDTLEAGALVDALDGPIARTYTLSEPGEQDDTVSASQAIGGTFSVEDSGAIVDVLEEVWLLAAEPAEDIIGLDLFNVTAQYASIIIDEQLSASDDTPNNAAYTAHFIDGALAYELMWHYNPYEFNLLLMQQNARD